MKMLKRMFALTLALMTTVCITGCKKNYVMTDYDLSVQEKLVGFWGADDSTGYNEHDENGFLTSIIIVEFTEDFYQRTHRVFINEGMIYSYEAVPYVIEGGEFRVMEDGVPSYANISMKKDGSEMLWKTDDKEDLFLKMSDEKAIDFGVVPYDSSKKNESEDADDGADGE